MGNANKGKVNQEGLRMAKMEKINMDCKFKTKKLRINPLSSRDITSLNQHKIQVFPNLPFP